MSWAESVTCFALVKYKDSVMTCMYAFLQKDTFVNSLLARE